jgi:hypothetical protein
MGGVKAKLQERSKTQEKSQSWLTTDRSETEGLLSIQDRFKMSESKFLAEKKEDGRMKAVNYKTLKLREMQN